MDLFDDDQKSRINLKPSRKWNEWIDSALKEGRCECVRCIENNYDQSGYKTRHTFNIGNNLISRRYAITAREDIDPLIKAAWISYYKFSDEYAELFRKCFDDNPVSLDMIKEFTDCNLHEKLVLLFNEIDNISLDGDKVIFSSESL